MTTQPAQHYTYLPERKQSPKSGMRSRLEFSILSPAITSFLDEEAFSFEDCLLAKRLKEPSLPDILVVRSLLL